ncbi:hypothetical protein [Paenibacillus cremeus]|uniref:DUF3604 domain-containing protein n=1 Tax=Paenibacillus cremeus TaxID=2163881 RepID=A0A559KFU3_9BACL|nr:hypothetical protein [Paenibacillus cremeus]TVY10989.1 hypothetical protein FPZ49_05810 [Paenibacillus cremeus]
MALRITKDAHAHCSMHRQFAYELVWLPEKNYIPGTEVELRAGNFRQHYEWKMHRIDMERSEVLFSPHISKAGPDVFQNRKQRIVLRARLLQMVPKGEPVAIQLLATPSLFAGMDLDLFVWIREPNSAWADKSAEAGGPLLKEAGEGCRLTVQAGPVERFSVYSHPVPGVDGKVRTCMVPEDRYGNPSSFAQAVTVSWTWMSETAFALMTSSRILLLDAPKKLEKVTVNIRMDDLSLDENIANGVVDGDNLVVIGNPVLAQAKQGLLPAFGDIHWHTEEAGGADGGRPMTEALTSARDALNMNFAAPSDHSPELSEWERTVRAIDAFNADDSFAVFYGWENSTNRGHENYYFTMADHAAVCGGSAGFKPGDLETSTNQLDALDDGFKSFLAVPHHTNSVATLKKDGVPAWYQYNWMEPRDYRRLVEIVQNRGNQEKNDYTDAWRGLVHNQSASVQDALRTGHRLGFTGGTDNHVGWPGRVIYQERKSVILTGVWTERVERDSLFQTLWNRHTWAVCDTRAIVWFELNGVLMGGVLRIAAGEELTAAIEIEAETPLQSIEIISEGQTVWASSSSSPHVELQVPLGTFRRSTHFYLRALQRDGGFMYASPIFVEEGSFAHDGSVSP